MAEPSSKFSHWRAQRENTMSFNSRFYLGVRWSSVELWCIARTHTHSVWLNTRQLSVSTLYTFLLLHTINLLHSRKKALKVNHVPFDVLSIDDKCYYSKLNTSLSACSIPELTYFVSRRSRVYPIVYLVYNFLQTNFHYFLRFVIHTVYDYVFSIFTSHQLFSKFGTLYVFVTMSVWEIRLIDRVAAARELLREVQQAIEVVTLIQGLCMSPTFNMKFKSIGELYLS